MSTPVRSGYYGVGDGVTVGVGVGVAAAQVKSDSTSFPGIGEPFSSKVNATLSMQLPVVWTTNFWLPFGLTLNAVTPSVPQLKTAMRSPGGIRAPTWLLAKCQVPIPLHLMPTGSSSTAARAGVTS